MAVFDQEAADEITRLHAHGDLTPIQMRNASDDSFREMQESTHVANQNSAEKFQGIAVKSSKRSNKSRLS